MESTTKPLSQPSSIPNIEAFSLQASLAATLLFTGVCNAQ